MSNLDPKVSVIIPTYNLAKVLTERAIPSILNQTHRNLECLVIDDGSTDDTEKRVQEIIKKDARLKYFKIKNSGQAAAKNFAVQRAVGDYIAFNDHDDEYLPNYLAVAVAKFEKLLSSVAYLSGGVINRDEFGMETYYLPQLEPFWKLAVGTGWIFRAAVFQKNKIKTSENISGFEDLDLHLKLRQHYQGYIIDQPLRVYYLRTKPSSSALALQEYHQRYLNSFNSFFSQYEKDYLSFGSAAAGWLYFFGGLVNMRAGYSKTGRDFLRRSWLAEKKWPTLIYLATSFSGRSLFVFLENCKTLLMRVLRSNLLNRLP